MHNPDLSPTIRCGALSGSPCSAPATARSPICADGSAPWWTLALLFWDDFSADGELGPEPDERSAVGARCLQREIAAGAHADFTFLLAWHFPNRTPDRCGWAAPKGEEDTRHRQPLLHALRRRVGRGRVRRREPGRAREEDARIRRRDAREHAARPP